MNIICSVLLIIAAGVIGRLWPRKSIAPVVIAAPTTSHEYGLYVPPNCDEINFKNLLSFFVYRNGDYNSISIKSDDFSKIKLVFKTKVSDFGFPSNEIKGVVK